MLVLKDCGQGLCPVVICDVCADIIDNQKEKKTGYVVWMTLDSARAGNFLFVHKEVCLTTLDHRAEAQIGHRVRTRLLTEFLAQLRANVHEPWEGKTANA
jgi:hypothetical protein